MTIALLGLLAGCWLILLILEELHRDGAPKAVQGLPAGVQKAGPSPWS